MWINARSHSSFRLLLRNTATLSSLVFIVEDQTWLSVQATRAGTVEKEPGYPDANFEFSAALTLARRPNAFFGSLVDTAIMT
jgi:hypothetical protein